MNERIGIGRGEEKGNGNRTEGKEMIGKRRGREERRERRVLEGKEEENRTGEEEKSIV